MNNHPEGHSTTRGGLARLAAALAASLSTAVVIAIAGCAAVGAATPPASTPASTLEAGGGHIQPAPAGQFETWAFATIRNNGAADALVEVRSPDAASVVLRATTLTDAGRKVRSVASIPLPAHAVTTLAADSFFLAFIQVKHALVPGQHVSATLRFASGAERVVAFLVSEQEGDPADAAQ